MRERVGIKTIEQHILDKQPRAMHDRTPLLIGSKDEVARVRSFWKA
jgi:fructose-1,6-bisphosphatase